MDPRQDKAGQSGEVIVYQPAPERRSTPFRARIVGDLRTHWLVEYPTETGFVRGRVHKGACSMVN